MGDRGRGAGPEGGEPEDLPRAADIAERSAGAAGSDDGAPVGPSEGEEVAFLAEQRAAEPARAPRRNGAPEEEEPTGRLPPLEDLVNRIPAPTRALLDELFRAKFVTVKRVPKAALK